MDIQVPFDSFEEPDEMVLVYTSSDKARKALEGLYERLFGLYPDLVGDHGGVIMEDDVLVFKGCGIFTWQPDDF